MVVNHGKQPFARVLLGELECVLSSEASEVGASGR